MYQEYKQEKMEKKINILKCGILKYGILLLKQYYKYFSSQKYRLFHIIIRKRKKKTRNLYFKNFEYA
ncbi:hypothetical protein PFAG_03617 [Plasmodium falciparum Santa Lucia]|uniref:Uncharacterized protein n=7 Tax=Plasmodium falciparum TaxID=5833 RepID=A0A024W657_PLAFA|nr:hypothetical protein PFFVO_03234 [Plasmodium falciparum Vietnam Oak-Knoll (FVO)]ETW35666.1 hypothetical protein PFTANZ_03619 [Plasmodium falciparum Tanzania (2000708)]ETW48436.1 hypothetical protein PFMALIP_03521 [Plasmodium falciparum MaliPS096_E11]ETW56320.1 hypothetical protein PFUGPA_01685 [Plasmodium falciparum Palo Alto/Uganda]ETW60560.1 hypothetical protein PFMC_03555 [Plasmodium falciparum CAMP/Malaysia]EUT83221.1 hypothetical protein PFAG_03617 [Plasmodium falciparum Santa Lucia]E